MVFDGEGVDEFKVIEIVFVDFECESSGFKVVNSDVVVI